MSDLGLLHVRVGEFLEALEVVVGKKRRRVPLQRGVPVSLTYDPATRELMVSEPRHGRRRHLLHADGVWPSRVQVDGDRLRSLLGKYPPYDKIGVMVTDKEITMLAGRSRIVLSRTDALRKPIEARAFAPNEKHRGKPYDPPDPAGKKVALDDTWGFSARVPMPQDRGRKKRPAPA